MNPERIELNPREIMHRRSQTEKSRSKGLPIRIHLLVHAKSAEGKVKTAWKNNSNVY